MGWGERGSYTRRHGGGQYQVIAVEWSAPRHRRPRRRHRRRSPSESREIADRLSPLDHHAEERLFQDNTRVHCDCIVPSSKDGINVHLLDLGRFGYKCRDLEQYVLQRLDIGRLRTAVPFEQRKTFDFFYHVPSVTLGYRHYAERNVLQKLDQDAANAKHEYRTELRVLRHPDDHFDARFGHVLHCYTIDLGTRLLCLCHAHNLFVCRFLVAK